MKYSAATILVLIATAVQCAEAAIDLKKMLCLVNEQRVKNNLKPLGFDQGLIKAAQAHSQLQANQRTMSHQLPGEQALFPRIDSVDSGNSWRSVAENVAWGQKDEEEVMDAWMKSPGHRANILGSYTHFGAGEASNGGSSYWTQDFAGDNKEYNFPACPGQSPSPSPSPSPSSTPLPTNTPKPTSVPPTSTPKPVPTLPTSLPNTTKPTSTSTTPGSPVPTSTPPAQGGACRQNQKVCDGAKIKFCINGQWVAFNCPASTHCTIPKYGSSPRCIFGSDGSSSPRSDTDTDSDDNSVPPPKSTTETPAGSTTKGPDSTSPTAGVTSTSTSASPVPTASTSEPGKPCPTPITPTE